MHLHRIIFVLVSMGLVSAAKKCSTIEYAKAKLELFNYLGLDNNDIQRTRMWPLIVNKYSAYNYTGFNAYNYTGLNLTNNTGVNSTSYAATIYVDLYVTSIINVNEKAQSLTIQVKMITAWPNLNLIWNNETFCGIETFVAPKNMFWIPDIGILESIKTEFGTKDSLNVILFNHGYTALYDGLALTTACKMDLYKFPFDTQNCNITLQSTVYTSEEIQIDTLTNQHTITHDSKEIFQAQGEWELLSITETKATFFKRIEIDQLIYQITIKRRPLLYVINIIVPVFFFLILDVSSFFIDTSRSDKLSFKVTLLLSISVMLLILNDTLPSTAIQIPLIGVYCCGIFCLMGISIVETIFVNYLMAKAKRLSYNGRDDAVRDQQNLPGSVIDQNEDQSCTLNCLKSRAAPDQNQREKISLNLTRVARIIDKTFLVLYIITIIVFLSVLGKLWIP